MSARSSVLLLLAVSLAASACKDKPADTNATPSATAATTASAKPAASAAGPWKDPMDDKSPAPAGVLPVGKPVDVKTLVMFDLPQPKSVPKAIWSSAYAEHPGDRLTNLMEGDDGWMGVTFIDCRRDVVATYVGKPLDDMGEFAYCFVTLPEKFKGYPSTARDQGGGGNAMWNASRVVRAGNMIVSAGAWERPKKPSEKWKLAQIDEVMNEMDWATIAKW